MSGDPPTEDGSPFPRPELDPVLGHATESAPASHRSRTRLVAIVAVVTLVAVGTVAGLAVGLEGDGDPNPGVPPFTTAPTSTEDGPPR
jgi:hypothetical protein